MTAPTFAIGEHDFLLDGKPFQILSGAMHYFRIHPGHWADRIRKARQMGLNTIETYVAWNAHAPRKGEFRLAGGLDLGRFLDLIAAEGMHAIVRPGPYICAEWANGGLPGWLSADPGTGIRRHEPAYLAAVTSYFRQLAPVLVPRQIGHGGPVILLQVENEYGAYGSDQTYLQALADLIRQSGITVPLTTVDQPAGTMLGNGSLPGALMTGSFGSRVAERLATLHAHQPAGPLMVSEFWDGWFDDWGAPHHVTAPQDTAADLDEILKQGASVNLYMFHGGTNFGLTSGANDKGTHRPIVTSYDYDAPLDEAGNPTPKYWALRNVVVKYAPVSDDIPAVAGPSPEFTAPLAQVLPLWDVLDRLGRWSRHDGLVSADALGQYQGFTLYRTQLGLTGPGVLEIDDVRDRAQVFLDRQPIGVLARDHHDRCLPLPADAHGVLELLVEDQGRVNYGPRIGEPKGLIGDARAGGQPLRQWDVMPLELTHITPALAALRSQPAATTGTVAGPAFARATFDLPEPGDLYLDTAGWGKGIAWINEFCLGRYWSRGPQRTLYVPGPVLRAGANELIILELHASAGVPATFVARPNLGPTEP
ncbi:MAG TPA: beta-galactosidase family protein [Streptosporangiaceae bacterium]|nr:beta-galactosidase family protein [Streptosporangiaceae bacterium]